MLTGRSLAELTARAVDGSAEYAAVWSREIHELEDALSRFLFREGGDGSHAGGVYGYNLTPFDLALDGGPEQIERAALRREDDCVAEPSHDQRTPAARIASGEEGVPDDDYERISSFHSFESVREPLFRQRCARAGKTVHEYLGVHRRAENRARLLELVPQLGCICEVAVVGQRDVTVAEAREDRLRILDG